MSRCRDKNSKSFSSYGGRGITVCDKWLKFEGFFDDMRESFVDGLTLDRIDVNGNYCKENCKWSTWKEQANNRRNTTWVSYREIRDTVTNWAKFLKIKRATLATRLYRGWTMEKIINYSNY